MKWRCINKPQLPNYLVLHCNEIYVNKSFEATTHNHFSRIAVTQWTQYDKCTKKLAIKIRVSVWSDDPHWTSLTHMFSLQKTLDPPPLALCSHILGFDAPQSIPQPNIWFNGLESDGPQLRQCPSRDTWRHQTLSQWSDVSNTLV